MERKGEKRSVEIRARNVEMAIEKGLAELGISRDKAEIVVIKEGSRGVLGIGAEDAVVRISTMVVPSPAVTPAEPQPAAEVVRADMTQAQQPEAERALTRQKSDREEVAKIAQDTLQTLLERMGMAVRVEIVENPPKSMEAAEDVIVLNVKGDDSGILIGRRGETLSDLQFITRLMVSRKIQRWPNIIVDVEYYKARREKLLTDLAHRMAEKARVNQQAVTLEPMPAHERRIIHLALQDAPGVFTQSTGEGPNRKVVILPKS